MSYAVSFCLPLFFTNPYNLMMITLALCFPLGTQGVENPESSLLDPRAGIGSGQFIKLVEFDDFRILSVSSFYTCPCYAHPVPVWILRNICFPHLGLLT